MSAIHIADTGFFVALGNPSNERYQHVRAFAKRNAIMFVVPKRIYEELTGVETSETVETQAASVDVAIDDGWVRIVESLEYMNPLVSKTMDGIQRYIANADERSADEIERADPALGALAAQVLSSRTRACIYATDIAAGEGAETLFASEGYDDAVTSVNGFRFIDNFPHLYALLIQQASNDRR